LFTGTYRRTYEKDTSTDHRSTDSFIGLWTPLPRIEKCVKIQATCSAKMISFFTAFFQLSVHAMNRNEVLIPRFRFTTKAGL